MVTISFNAKVEDVKLYTTLHAIIQNDMELVIDDEDVAYLLDTIVESGPGWAAASGPRYMIHAVMRMVETMAQDLTVKEFVDRYYTQKAEHDGGGKELQEEMHTFFYKGDGVGWGNRPLPLYSDSDY